MLVDQTKCSSKVYDDLRNLHLLQTDKRYEDCTGTSYRFCSTVRFGSRGACVNELLIWRYGHQIVQPYHLAASDQGRRFWDVMKGKIFFVNF